MSATTFWTKTLLIFQNIGGTVVYGRAVDPLALPTYSVDDPAPLLIDMNTGKLLDSGSGGGGGNLATAAKGATTAGNPTSTAASADRQLLDVILRDASGNALAVGGGTQYTTQTSQATPVGTVAFGKYVSSPPTLTSGWVSELQLDVNGNLKVNQRNLTASDIVTGLITQWGGTNVLTGGVAGSVGIGGLSASGATKSGNPVLGGLVFNTTQPTVANGQTVEAQGTARGASIVATGVDGFSVNITQFGGVALNTGTGASGTGTPRVTVANDSSIIALPTQGTLTDGSGTITTGGTAQQAFASNASRKYLLIQNNSSQNLWINFTTTAVQVQPSILILPYGSYEAPAHWVSTELVSIIGPTTGQAFTAKQA